MQVKNYELEPCMGQLTGSRLIKEYKVLQICLLSPYLFNLYAEHIMRNARLDELQAGVKTAWSINNLRYADDTTLMAESKEKLKNLLMSVKGESEKAGLKLNIKKKKATITASGPITSWQIEGEEVEAVTNFIFIGSKVTADCTHEIRRLLLLGRKTMTETVC